MVKAHKPETEYCDVYVYIQSDTDLVDDGKRLGWHKTGLKLKSNEVIEKISYRAKDWGGNNIVWRRQDLNQLVANAMTLCEAMFVDNTQRDAWKGLLKQAIYMAHDSKMNLYHLEDALKRDKVGFSYVVDELVDLAKSFEDSPDKSYSGQQIHQVIRARGRSED